MSQQDDRPFGKPLRSFVSNERDHGHEHGWHHAEVRSFLRHMSLFKPQKDVPRRFDELLERLDMAEARARRR